MIIKVLFTYDNRLTSFHIHQVEELRNLPYVSSDKIYFVNILLKRVSSGLASS